MAIEQIMNEELIRIIQWGTGIIGVLIAALATVYTKLIMSTIRACNNSLKEEIGAVRDYTHDTRDLATQSHNRITDHIITHHTKKDP